MQMRYIDRKDKIILFDLDGTLIDSTEAILESFSVAYEHHGESSPDTDLIKSKVGSPLDMMFSSLGVDEHLIEDFVERYRQHYQQICCDKTILLPGAREAVELAHEYAHLGVVTTKTAKYSIEILEYLEIMDHFDILIGRENVVNPKPHPEPILKALKQLPKVTSGIWMIGDTYMDIEAASAANIQSMAVLCGYGSEDELKKYSEKICQNTLEAVQTIAKI